MEYDIYFICTYKLLNDIDEDDKNILYQIQLLQAFNINNFELLDEKINKLYETIKDSYQLKEYLKSNNFFNDYLTNPLYIFKFLFSYDYFDSFHKCLVNILKNKI